MTEEQQHALVMAIHGSYGDEIAKLKMQIVRYRELLVENGIEPPDMEGADLLEMWQNCRQVLATAYEFVIGLGTSKELISGKWR